MSNELAQSGYERDLQLAEIALLGSGNDPAAYARALRDYFAAHRNYTQGAMVPMFVSMVEKVLDDKLTPVVLGIGGLQQSVTLLNNEFQTLSDTVSDLMRDMVASRIEQQALRAELAIVKEALVDIRVDLKGYKAGSKRNDVAILIEQVAELRSIVKKSALDEH